LRAQVRLLRYILDSSGSTARSAAETLQMSVPNVSRLVSAFRESGLVVGREHRQTGRRGPWSQVLSLRPRLGCSVGIDLEATRLRAIVVDFANGVTHVRRRAIPSKARPDGIVSAVAGLARGMVQRARRDGIEPCAVGLALPGPMLDAARGRIETELQFGKALIEFGPAVEAACRIPVVAASNTHCFALAHHRQRSLPHPGVEMVILVRFGIGVAIVSEGGLYPGGSHTRDLGLLRSGVIEPGRRYINLCTGSSLLRLERQRGGRRDPARLMQSPDDPVVRQWLKTALPAFAEAVFTSIVLYDPDRTVIEGLLNHLPASRREEILELVHQEVDRVRLPRRPIAFFEGDDLMGARGAALLARDQVAMRTLEHIVVSRVQ
jgi:predicted NBD/HSP70 family sugar kinase